MKFDDNGTEMMANGQKYVQQATTAGIQIGAVGARRAVALMGIIGTGTVTLYDGTSTGGTVILPASAMAVGTRVNVDWPCENGLFAVVGASTTVNILYS